MNNKLDSFNKDKNQCRKCKEYFEINQLQHKDIVYNDNLEKKLFCGTCVKALQESNVVEMGVIFLDVLRRTLYEK